jgi:hypothetical protein
MIPMIFYPSPKDSTFNKFMFRDKENVMELHKKILKLVKGGKKKEAGKLVK